MKTALILLCTVVLLPFSAFAKGIVVSLKKPGQFQPGSIVILQKKRALYFVLDSHTAIRYRVAVPKKEYAWSGYAQVVDKQWQPSWSPPAIVKRDNPHLPDFIPGGSPKNPMGVAAIVLSRPEIAIHGTAKSMRKSIGTSASYGCIRMLNEDISDLYRRVQNGTVVLMIP